MGRATEANYSDSTPDVSYTYDDAGRMQTMTDGLGEQDYGYDADDRLTSADRGSSGFAYSYADGLNLTGETYPNGASITDAYTDDELLHTTAAGGATTTFTYTPDDQLDTTTYPSGVGYTETRGYDADGNLESVANTNSSGTLSSFAWTLNEDGEPEQIAATRGSTTTNEALTYDPMDRLTEACYSTTTCTAAPNTISYAYDGDSNVTQQVRAGSVPNPGTTNYTYNTADQLTQAAVSGGGTTSYTHTKGGDPPGLRVAGPAATVGTRRGVRTAQGIEYR
jgi:YD repeat-containing protein